MKTKHSALLICWLIMVTMFTLDMISTVLAVEVIGAYETNYIIRDIVNTMGLIGYMYSYLIIIAILFMWLVITEFSVSTIYKLIYRHEEMKIEFSIFVFSMITSTYLIMDFLAFINNMSIVLSHL